MLLSGRSKAAEGWVVWFLSAIRGGKLVGMNGLVEDLGRRTYGPALALQSERVAAVAAGTMGPTLFFVEHEPVITVSRRPQAAGHVLATEAQLADHGVTLMPTDRGGDVTYHGPGQWVVYPVVRLSETGLSLTGYLRALEQAVVAAVGRFGIEGVVEPGAAGVWAALPKGQGLAKLCAMGVRLRRGVTMHGLALNVNPNMRHFELINPCGLGRPVTCLQALLGDATPTMKKVKAVLAEELIVALKLRPADTKANA